MHTAAKVAEHNGADLIARLKCLRGVNDAAFPRPLGPVPRLPRPQIGAQPLATSMSTVYASAYPERWQTVPPPTQPLDLVTSGFWPDTLTWAIPNLGGTFEIRNALVSKDHRVGAWSQPFTFTANSGWRAVVGCWNQIPTRNCIGVVWKIKATALLPDPNALSMFQVGKDVTHWLMGSPALATTPWSPAWPRLQTLYQATQWFPATGLRLGGANTLVAPPPVVIIGNIPMVDMQLAWCWVTHKGETALSAPLTIDNDPANSDYWSTISVRIGNESGRQQTPLGALGYHIYVNLAGAGWQRVPAPHCTGVPSTPEDWNFWLDDMKPEIYRVVPGAPAHNPAALAQSWCDSVSIAMNDTTGDVIVDIDPVPGYAPMINQYETYGTTNTAFKTDRRISTVTGGRWRFNHTPTFVQGTPYNTHPTNFPMWLEQNSRSTVVGMAMNGAPSAYIAFSCYDGGQCFKNRFVDVTGGLVNGGTELTRTFGVRAYENNFNAGSDALGSGHSMSETTYENCNFNGSTGYAIEHEQSANIRFKNCFGSSFGPPDFRNCAVWWNTPVSGSFVDGFFADCPGNSIFLIGRCTKILVDGIWVDQGCISLFDALATQAPEIQLTNGTVNFWADANATLWLMRVFNSNDGCSLTCSNVSIATNNGNMNVNVSNTSYYRTWLFFTDTWLSDITILREPNQQQFATATAQYSEAEGKTDEFLNPDQPGITQLAPAFAVEIPSFPIVSERQHIAFVVPAQAFVVNSFTGAPVVQRVDWWS